MPPKQRIVVQRAEGRRAAPQGYASSIYSSITSPENASVVRSIAIFGAAVAFFSSSWSEFIVPPM